MSEKSQDPVMVCKDMVGQNLKLSRCIGSSMVQTWSVLFENHPLSIMTKWMTETYIEAILNSNQSQT